MGGQLNPSTFLMTVFGHWICVAFFASAAERLGARLPVNLHEIESTWQEALNTLELLHGCRAEHGPLELRIQTTDSLNGFMVYVEDPRLENPRVYEQSVQSTLDSAKDHLILKAGEYLDSHQESAQYSTEWRCS